MIMNSLVNKIYTYLPISTFIYLASQRRW